MLSFTESVKETTISVCLWMKFSFKYRLQAESVCLASDQTEAVFLSSVTHLHCYTCLALACLAHVFVLKAGTDYRTYSMAQPPWHPRTWCSRVWEKMLVAQTAAAAGPNQHSVAKNAFVFVLKTDNFLFVSRQYNSASEHIHSMFAACLLIVHTRKHHVLGCRVRLCHGICSKVCTGLNVDAA